jgi:hypothetical protein
MRRNEGARAHSGADKRSRYQLRDACPSLSHGGCICPRRANALKPQLCHDASLCGQDDPLTPSAAGALDCGREQRPRCSICWTCGEACRGKSSHPNPFERPVLRCGSPTGPCHQASPCYRKAEICRPVAKPEQGGTRRVDATHPNPGSVRPPDDPVLARPRGRQQRRPISWAVEPRQRPDWYQTPRAQQNRLRPQGTQKRR